MRFLLALTAAASLAALAIHESRRASVPRPQRRGFVSYRASGKVPVYQSERSIGGPHEDDEPGAERDELL